MEVKATAKHIKMSSQKLRLVADIIRSLSVEKAFDQLNHIHKKAVEPLSKLVKSAVANATNNFDLQEENLYIKELRVDGGPTLHRWTPKARGRATPIRKRTSHISLTLGEIVDSGKTRAKQQKIDAPVKLGAKAKEDEGVKVEEKGEEKTAQSTEEKGKKIIDPRSEGKGRHTRIEGKGAGGFAGKFFRRKSG